MPTTRLLVSDCAAPLRTLPLRTLPFHAGPRGAALLATVLLCAALLGSGCSTAREEFRYPETRQGSVVDDYHGTLVADPYRWLETLDSDETVAWIDAQNALTEPYLLDLAARPVFVERLRELQESVPPPIPGRQGAHWVTRTRAPDGTPVLLVQDALDAPPRMRIDLSTLAPDAETVLRTVRLSPDGRYLAYSVAPGNADLTEVRIRDLTSGRDLEDRIPDVALDVFEWLGQVEGSEGAEGTEAILYGRYLESGAQSPDRINRAGIIGVHLLGTPPAQDRVLHRVDTAEGEAVPLVELSSDRRFVFLKDYLGQDGRFWILDLHDPRRPRFDAPAVPWGTEREGRTVLVGSVGSTLYLRTNRAAPNFQVVAVDGTDPSSWRTVVPETEHLLEHALLVGEHLVTAHRRDVQSALAVHSLDGTRLREIPLPASGSAYLLGGGAGDPTLTFGFDSFAHPPVAFRHDTRTGATVQFGASDLDVDPSGYVTRQVFFSSKDGTRVPMFIVHRADRPADRPAPTLLFGYGASGVVQEPIFSEKWFAWVEAGGVFALANLRGGGEYGEAWRLAGVLANRQNTFDDFIAAAEHLIREGITTPEHLAIHGISDGGLLVGAVMTQRPELFAAAVPEVGILDALRNASLAVGPHWILWSGDPSIPEQFAWLHAWSPLHALRDGTCYPATLVVTSANDDRVHPSQSYKFAARLQAAQACDRPTLLRVEATGGHHGGVDAEDRIRRQANVLAFAAEHTGLVVSGE